MDHKHFQHIRAMKLYNYMRDSQKQNFHAQCTVLITYVVVSTTPR